MQDNDRTLKDIVEDITPELLQPPYKASEIAKADWHEARETLMTLQKEGKLTFEADDEETPYSLHTFQIHWKFNDMGDCEIDARQIAGVLSKVGDLIIDEDDSSWWQLSRRLYVPSD